MDDGARGPDFGDVVAVGWGLGARLRMGRQRSGPAWGGALGVGGRGRLARRGSGAAGSGNGGDFRAGIHLRHLVGRRDRGRWTDCRGDGGVWSWQAVWGKLGKTDFGRAGLGAGWEAFRETRRVGGGGFEGLADLAGSDLVHGWTGADAVFPIFRFAGLRLVSNGFHVCSHWQGGTRRSRLGGGIERCDSRIAVGGREPVAAEPGLISGLESWAGSLRVPR